jgi:hypothetical protein
VRAGLPLTPTGFFIDEGGAFLEQDSALVDILSRAAEAKISVTLGIQDMSDLPDTQLRNAVFTNCAYKFAAHTNGEIHELARSMATVPDFIHSLGKHEFAYIGPDMESAGKLKFPLVEFDTMPRMSDAQYAELRQRNRERYGYRPEPDLEPEPEQPPLSRPQKRGRRIMGGDF